MKTIIIYYSRTGTTKKVAEKLHSLIKSAIQEITDLKNRTGIVGFMTADKDGIQGNTTQIKPEKLNLEKYDLVILGTPNWAGNMASAIRTVLVKNKIKKAAFFCTCESNEGKIFSEMEKLTGSKPKATLILKTKNVAKGEIESDLKQFTKECLN